VRARLLAVAIGLGVLASFAAVGSQTQVGATAQAQIPTALTIPPLPPTFPCPLCGPSGLVDSGVVAWAYPLHFCPDDGTGDAVFAIIYGWGRNNTGPATFWGSIQGKTRELKTLQPGDETAEYPAVRVPPGDTFFLTVWATTDGTVGGPRVLFGNGTHEKDLTLVCSCPQPTPLVTTIPNVPTTPAVGPTTSLVATSVAHATTTIPGSLPATGTNWWILLVPIGIICMYVGLLAWSHTRRLDD